MSVRLPPLRIDITNTSIKTRLCIAVTKQMVQRERIPYKTDTRNAVTRNFLARK
jgi:hypothetical protein